MDGQLLYLSRRSTDDVWKIQSIPISQAYIDSTEPSSPIAPLRCDWNVIESLVDELSKLCGDNGAMKGWKLRYLGDPELQFQRDDIYNAEEKYCVRVILTRQIEPLAPNTSNNESVPDAGKKSFDRKLECLSREG